MFKLEPISDGNGGRGFKRASVYKVGGLWAAVLMLVSIGGTVTIGPSLGVGNSSEVTAERVKLAEDGINSNRERTRINELKIDAMKERLDKLDDWLVRVESKLDSALVRGSGG